MKDRLTTAPLPMERPQGSCGTWNARSATGTGFSLWNSPQAIGTAAGYWNGPWPMERPQGYFVLFVGRRYYLRWREVFFPGSPKSFARMGRGGMMERYISIYRNLLAKPSPTIRASSECECKGTAFLAFGQ